jgi:hypothetical protein
MNRTIRRLINPIYEAGQRLHLAGISPEGAAIAAAFAITVGLSAIALSIQDRAFIESCKAAGGSAELCTLKVSGR